MVFADHGAGASGEPLAIMLRPGNAGSNTAADHVQATRLALAQLPAWLRRRVLIRADSGGGTQERLAWLARPGRGGWPTRSGSPSPGRSRTPSSRFPRRRGLRLRQRTPGAPGRVGRGDHRHAGPVRLAPGHAGHRPPGTPAPRRAAAVHRRRRAPVSPVLPPAPRAGSSPTWNYATGAGLGARIRCAKDTGLRDLPLHGFAQNQIWCEIVALACELLAWTQMFAFDGLARRWEHKRVRLRIFSVAGRLVRGGLRLRLRLAPVGPGPPRSPPRSPGCTPSHLADQPEPSLRPERNPPGPVEPRPPGATAGPPGTPDAENSARPQPQATQPRSRKIEANVHRAVAWRVRHGDAIAAKGEGNLLDGLLAHSVLPGTSGR